MVGRNQRGRARRWAIEGATGVGKNVAQRLVASGEVVFDVPSKKSSLVRAFSATSGRKSDAIEWVRKHWRYHAGVQNGTPVAMTTEAEIRFDIRHAR